MKKSLLFLLAAVTSVAVGQDPQAPTHKNISEYMQRVGLLYLETADTVEASTAKSLDGDSKLLNQLEDRIRISLQHEESPQKEADERYFALLQTVGGLADAAGMDIYGNLFGGAGSRAWTVCYATAKIIATSGELYEAGSQKCDAAYEVYAKAVHAKAELDNQCDKLKKPKDQKKCREGKIAPPS